MRKFLHDHGLSIVMLGILFLGIFFGQIATGRLEYNDERRQRGQPELGYVEYLGGAHFGEATAENWESEFLQMFVFVLATAFLYQKGSASSRDPRSTREPPLSWTAAEVRGQTHRPLAGGSEISSVPGQGSTPSIATCSSVLSAAARNEGSPQRAMKLNHRIRWFRICE